MLQRVYLLRRGEDRWIQNVGGTDRDSWSGQARPGWYPVCTGFGEEEIPSIKGGRQRHGEGCLTRHTGSLSVMMIISTMATMRIL